ncbi:MAG: hypothetical protein KF722_18550, partial [Nitrospira sp.]|nr:hypothetical protein [Nitrospira sp.]
MHQTQTIRWSMAISIAMTVSVCWSLSYAGTIGDGHSAIEPTTPNMMTSSTPIATEVLARPLPSAAVPIENGLVLRTLPSVSKPISMGGTTLVPYIGAGFGGGYATELDRSLDSASSFSSSLFNPGLKNFGQSLVPNEVQLGIRFP